MCFHRESDFDAWKRATNAPKHAAQVIMRHTTPASRFGAFSEGFPVDARNAQEVANVVKELRKWHEGEGDKVVDLKHVNEVREAHGLEFLDANGLPLPNRKERESINLENFDEAKFREIMVGESVSAVVGVFAVQQRKRKVQGVPEPTDDSAKSPATLAREAEERAIAAEREALKAALEEKVAARR
jgi:hypothetical protein